MFDPLSFMIMQELQELEGYLKKLKSLKPSKIDIEGDIERNKIRKEIAFERLRIQNEDKIRIDILENRIRFLEEQLKLQTEIAIFYENKFVELLKQKKY